MLRTGDMQHDGNSTDVTTHTKACNRDARKKSALIFHISRHCQDHDNKSQLFKELIIIVIILTDAQYLVLLFYFFLTKDIKGLIPGQVIYNCSNYRVGCSTAHNKTSIRGGNCVDE